MSRIDRRRDATRVIYEILSIGAMGASKSNIIFKVNLNHKLDERYTIFLIKKSLLRVESDSRSKRYFLTEKGEHLLTLLCEVEKELDDFYVMSLSTEPQVPRRASRTLPGFGSERGRVPIEIQRALSS